MSNFSVLPIENINTAYLLTVSLIGIFASLGYSCITARGKRTKNRVIAVNLLSVILFLLVLLSNNTFFTSNNDLKGESLNKEFSKLVSPIVKGYSKDSQPKISISISEEGVSRQKGRGKALDSVKYIQYLIVKFPETKSNVETTKIYPVKKGELEEPIDLKTTELKGEVLTATNFLDEKELVKNNKKTFKIAYYVYYYGLAMHFIFWGISVVMLCLIFKNSDKYFKKVIKL